MARKTPRRDDYDPIFPRGPASGWWIVFLIVSGLLALGAIYLCMALEAAA